MLKKVGFLLPFVAFLFALYSLLSHSTRANIAYIAILLAMNLLVTAADKYTSIPQFKELGDGQLEFVRRFNGIIFAILLFFVYVVGVTLSYIFSRFIKNPFLRPGQNTRWAKKIGKIDYKEQF